MHHHLPRGELMALDLPRSVVMRAGLQLGKGIQHLGLIADWQFANDVQILTDQTMQREAYQIGSMGVGVHMTGRQLFRTVGGQYAHGLLSDIPHQRPKSR